MYCKHKPSLALKTIISNSTNGSSINKLLREQYQEGWRLASIQIKENNYEKEAMVIINIDANDVSANGM
jgi:hypothetical protein